jgi:hypothetical protein
MLSERSSTRIAFSVGFEPSVVSALSGFATGMSSSMLT